MIQFDPYTNTMNGILKMKKMLFSANKYKSNDDAYQHTQNVNSTKNKQTKKNIQKQHYENKF